MYKPFLLRQIEFTFWRKCGVSWYDEHAQNYTETSENSDSVFKEDNSVIMAFACASAQKKMHKLCVIDLEFDDEESSNVTEQASTNANCVFYLITWLLADPSCDTCSPSRSVINHPDMQSGDTIESFLKQY